MNYQGKPYRVHHLKETAFDKDQDPCHDGDCVAAQLSNGNGGFVGNYAQTHPKDPDPWIVMGYEHGGFYDHLPTPPADDDDPNFRRFGVRVPAFIVSPWVEQGKVSSTTFDHTSIIKSILLKFCQKRDGTIPDMGARVTHANHLGSLLTRETPREAPSTAAYQHALR